MTRKKGRIYVCHTFYHVYISFLKEFNQPESEKGNATMVLSLMSNDFGDIKDRIVDSKYFREVYEFDEKRETEFPELAKYKKDRGNVIFNMLPRIIFTKKFAKLQGKYVPVDFNEYDEIYVFCDADPIGLYLNQKRIRYHAVEDGLDCLGRTIPAKRDNPNGFRLKKYLSMGLNLIFLQEGYSKYCIDVEVNNVSLLDDSLYKYKEVPRKELESSMTESEKDVLIKVFVKDIDRMNETIDKTGGNEDNILILTEPLCTLDVRERIFRDLVNEYRAYGNVFLKIHPRDVLDYEHLFNDVFQFDKRVPMEIFNLFSQIHFKKVVSVFTELGGVSFAEEKIRLGNRFMDKYEDPSVHAFLKE